MSSLPDRKGSDGVDRAAIARWLAWLLRRLDGAVEVRILWPRGAFGGVVTDAQSGAAAIAEVLSRPSFALANVYACLGALSPEARKRARRGLQPLRRATTDEDIDRRRLLFLDIDPTREEGFKKGAASDAEMAEAVALAERVREFLRESCWPEPVFILSGNGVALLYPADMPADVGDALKRLYAELATKFDTHGAHVDRSVHNPSRLARVPGTWNRKGDGAGDRPHRLARIVGDLPADDVPPVTLQMVEALLPPRPSPRHQRSRAQAEPGDAEGDGGSGVDGGADGTCPPHVTAYVRDIAREVAGTPAQGGPHGGRDNALWRAAYTFGGLRGLPHRLAEELLVEAGTQCGLADPNELGDEGLRAKVSRGLREGANMPWAFPCPTPSRLMPEGAPALFLDEWRAQAPDLLGRARERGLADERPVIVVSPAGSGKTVGAAGLEAKLARQGKLVVHAAANHKLLIQHQALLRERAPDVEVMRVKSASPSSLDDDGEPVCHLAADYERLGAPGWWKRCVCQDCPRGPSAMSFGGRRDACSVWKVAPESGVLLMTHAALARIHDGMHADVIRRVELIVVDEAPSPTQGTEISADDLARADAVARETQEALQAKIENLAQAGYETHREERRLAGCRLVRAGVRVLRGLVSRMRAALAASRAAAKAQGDTWLGTLGPTELASRVAIDEHEQEVLLAASEVEPIIPNVHDPSRLQPGQLMPARLPEMFAAVAALGVPLVDQPAAVAIRGKSETDDDPREGDKEPHPVLVLIERVKLPLRAGDLVLDATGLLSRAPIEAVIGETSVVGFDVQPHPESVEERVWIERASSTIGRRAFAQGRLRPRHRVPFETATQQAAEALERLEATLGRCVTVGVVASKRIIQTEFTPGAGGEWLPGTLGALLGTPAADTVWFGAGARGFNGLERVDVLLVLGNGYEYLPTLLAEGELLGLNGYDLLQSRAAATSYQGLARSRSRWRPGQHVLVWLGSYPPPGWEDIEPTERTTVAEDMAGAVDAVGGRWGVAPANLMTLAAAALSLGWRTSLPQDAQSNPQKGRADHSETRMPAALCAEPTKPGESLGGRVALERESTCSSPTPQRLDPRMPTWASSGRTARRRGRSLLKRMAEARGMRRVAEVGVGAGRRWVWAPADVSAAEATKSLERLVADSASSQCAIEPPPCGGVGLSATPVPGSQPRARSASDPDDAAAVVANE